MRELENSTNSMSRLPVKSNPPAGRDIIMTYRERLALEEIERLRLRTFDLAEQRSDSNPSNMRIRVWEKTHALRLPADPAHPIIDVIAQDTGLSREDVQHEQRRRTEITAVSPA